MERRRDGMGSVVGLLVFLTGIALIGLAFFLAHQLFNTPPSESLNLGDGQSLNITRTVQALLGLLARILLLLVMCAGGGVIATRGVKLYASSLHPHEPKA